MSKLSLDALKERAEATASTELLATISGGLENACLNNLTGHVEVDTKLLPQPTTTTVNPGRLHD